MRKYKFFHLEDSKEETIGTAMSDNVENATKIFSKRKKLDLEEFLKIFGVKKINE